MYLVRPGPAIRFWRLLQRASVAAYEDNCLGIAKGAAYSALLSFFPVLGSLAAILIQVNAEPVLRIIYRLLGQVIPPGSEEAVNAQFRIVGSKPVSLLVLASLLSLWAASGAMISLMEGFQAAYQLPSGRSFIRQRAVAVLLVFAAALPVVGGSILIFFGRQTEKTFLLWLGFLSEGAEFRGPVIFVGRLVRYVTAVASIVLATGLLYFFGPNRPMKLRRVWPGAFLATVLWLLATSGFAWYVRNVAHYNVLYGSVGAAIALLVWMYLLAIIALFGCEYNAQKELLDP